MKQSIGYTVSLNIVIVFIVIIFAFIGGAISYYKAFKINNIIADNIEKYEGYNTLSAAEIRKQLASLGYNMSSVNCGVNKVKGHTAGQSKAINENNELVDMNGHIFITFVYYNVSKCLENSSQGYNDYCPAESYNYIVKTYLRFNIPIVNQWIKFPVYSKTNSIYACYGDNC